MVVSTNIETPNLTIIMREFINPLTVVVTILWEEIKSCPSNQNYFFNVQSLGRENMGGQNSQTHMCKISGGTIY